LESRPVDPDYCGYYWEYANWGCKWGACDARLTEDQGCLIYTFDTPWSPPLHFLQKTSAIFPDLTFRIEFQEPNMGFAGHAVIVNGEIVEFEEHEFNWEEEEAEESGEE